MHLVHCTIMHHMHHMHHIHQVLEVLEEQVPKCGVKEAPANERLGRRVEVPSLRPGGRAAVHSLREQTFHISGARLFNILPKNIRNTKYSQDEFKMALDQFLATLPDQPRMGGLVPEALDQVTGRSSNSLLAWGSTMHFRVPT